jgi:hypothetical protein
MLADLDLLLTAVFCAADDLLPKRARNARRRITDAEVVTLRVAQAVLGISSDRQFCGRPSASSPACFRCFPARTRSGSAARG